MGTRSLTVFKDENNQEICVLYRQFDGYPSGHGADLLAQLKGRGISNGISMAKTGRVQPFNGTGDLVVRVITGLKCDGAEQTQRVNKLTKTKTKPTPAADEPGNFYLHPPGTRDAGEDYIYVVYMNDYPNGYWVDGQQAKPTPELWLKIISVGSMYPKAGRTEAVLYDGSVEKLVISKLEKEEDQ